MSPELLENTLRDLPRVGTLIKDRGYRQIWRFEIAGRGYYLKFFRRASSRLKRTLRGNPALREFTGLQCLQKANVPSPRAVALLAGFVLAGVKGDAVISEAIEPSQPLDQYLNQWQLKGVAAPDHRKISEQIRDILTRLGAAGFGHQDLHLGNFLRTETGLFLLDAYAVRPGGLKTDHILRLGHSVARYATRGDILRGWHQLAGEAPIPTTNPLSKRIWNRFVKQSKGANRYFGHEQIAGWHITFFKNWKYPYRHAQASTLNITSSDWQREWPALLSKIDSGSLETIKSTRSGDVLATTLSLGGQTLDVIVKRPRRKRWYRYINEIGRGSRVKRAWIKSWSLITRNLTVAWPLAMLERKVMGYTVDQILICQRVPGGTLAVTDLNAIPEVQRQTMFSRAGRILRRIEQAGFCHFDAKASNWIILPDEKRGPTPVMIDVDGVRFYRWDTFGIDRLLRSMKEHPQYTPADSLALCRGYAPFTRIDQEQEMP